MFQDNNLSSKLKKNRNHTHFKRMMKRTKEISVIRWRPRENKRDKWCWLKNGAKCLKITSDVAGGVGSSWFLSPLNLMHLRFTTFPDKSNAIITYSTVPAPRPIPTTTCTIQCPVLSIHSETFPLFYTGWNTSDFQLFSVLLKNHWPQTQAISLSPVCVSPAEYIDIFSFHFLFILLSITCLSNFLNMVH